MLFARLCQRPVSNAFVQTEHVMGIAQRSEVSHPPFFEALEAALRTFEWDFLTMADVNRIRVTATEDIKTV